MYIYRIYLYSIVSCLNINQEAKTSSATRDLLVLHVMFIELILQTMSHDSKAGFLVMEKRQ